MGEYSLYLDGVLIGGIYDNRLLLKETAENIKYELPRVIPYDSAKRTMVHVEDLENEEILWGIVLETKEGLTQKNTWELWLLLSISLNKIKRIAKRV